MSEMVKRVGDVIATAHMKNMDIRQLYAQMARAAIAAMRDPTVAMCAAGDEAMPAAEGYSLPNDCPRVWHAMIDIALADETMQEGSHAS